MNGKPAVAYVIDMKMKSGEIFSLVLESESDYAQTAKAIDECKTFLDLQDFSFD